MNVAPSTAYEAVLFHGTTGLAGTIRLRTIDNDGVVTQAAASTGITEVAYGVYSAERTSPGTAGQYTLVWDDGTTNGVLAVEDLNVTTAEDSVTVGASNMYVSLAEVKDALALAGTTFADDVIDDARNAASRAIDGFKGMRFYPTTETRYFTAEPGAAELELDDEINSLTSVAVDETGTYAYATAWTSGTEFVLSPVNAPLEGRPYERLTLLRQNGAVFPTYENAVKVVGSWGWAATPPQVKLAAKILSVRWLVRSKSAPLGILPILGEGVAAARLGRVDPDVATLLDSVRPRGGRAGSIQLG